MDMQGEQRIPAPRAVVWAALNDPDVLKECIPGCQTIEKTSDTGFSATVIAKVGPVSAKFNGKVSLTDIDPPNGYTISGEGQGGVAGFGKGSAKVALSDDGDGTLLRYTVNAQVGGKLAQIGSRLVDGAAAKMADDFFAKFNQVAAARAHPVAEMSGGAEPGVAAVAAPAPVSTPPTNSGGGLRPALWIPALIVVVGVVLYLILR